MTEYNYCDKDLLRNPEKYQMSKYEGKEFLNAYVRSRENIIKKLDIANNKNLEEIVSEKFVINKPTYEHTIETQKLLSSVLVENIQHVNQVQNKTIVDIFVKKFEVKRKIVTEYDNKYKEKTDDYFDLKNYVLLSANCLVLYLQTANLRYLNTCLKLNDVIISNLDEKLEERFKQLFSIIVQKELDCINNLCLKKGL